MNSAPPEPMNEEARQLLDRLVALDTTNIEDPSHHRIEKRNYARAASFLEQVSRERGLRARIWDAREELQGGRERFAEPRPNVIVELDRGMPRWLLILAHFDVVPVPEEQLGRWKSPPHTLTRRPDGRYYGRGAADDLGSGVVPGLLALTQLHQLPSVPANVRLLICGDEETGGMGGIEALREHDHALPAGHPDRLLTAEMALIPDGSPYVAAGSSGVSFVDVRVPSGARVSEFLRVSESLTAFREVASGWTSKLPAPPEPSGPSPNPHILGRATPTLEHLDTAGPASGTVRLQHIHSNSDAGNQIPATVTLTFSANGPERDRVRSFFSGAVRPPYHLDFREAGDALTVEVVGSSGHGGYPHRANNPVPEATRLLIEAIHTGALPDGEVGAGTMTLDLRSPPEMVAQQALDIFQNYFRRIEDEVPGTRAEVPPGRERSGYFISPDHPRVRALQKIYEEVSGHPIGIYGEYGGTDASALREITTPAGQPLPVVVLGGMDAQAHIHDAEESIDPRYLDEVTRLLVRWVRTFE